MATLLKAAADELEDGRQPLATGWLSDNGVTFDECLALAEALATGARLYAWALEHPDEARGALEGAHTVTAYKALAERRGDDWCTAVLGRPTHGHDRCSRHEEQLLIVVDAADVDPALPGWIVEGRAAGARRQAEREQAAAAVAQRTAGRWAKTRTTAASAGVELDVHDGSRLRAWAAGPIGHAVPGSTRTPVPAGSAATPPAGLCANRSGAPGRSISTGPPTGRRPVPGASTGRRESDTPGRSRRDHDRRREAGEQRRTVLGRASTRRRRR